MTHSRRPTVSRYDCILCFILMRRGTNPTTLAHDRGYDPTEAFKAVTIVNGDAVCKMHADAIADARTGKRPAVETRRGIR